MNEFKKNIFKKQTSVTAPALDLDMTASSPLPDGSGTLDFVNGQPNEVINLYFEYTGEDTLTFDTPVSVPILDSLHTTRTGTVTLNASGIANSNYMGSASTFSCIVTITGRSSGLPLPSKTMVVFSNY